MYSEDIDEVKKALTENIKESNKEDMDIERYNNERYK